MGRMGAKALNQLGKTPTNMKFEPHGEFVDLIIDFK